MKKLNKNEYTIVNGHKFFYTPNDKGFQCAYCLYVQEREFVRNKEGLIIGAIAGWIIGKYVAPSIIK